MKTVKDVKDYAMKNYENGGDVIIECWTDKEIQQLLDECKAENKNPKEVIDTIISTWNEKREAARYFSGEAEEYDNSDIETDENNIETEDEYDDIIDDPCYGCMARDNSYNCKHCPHGDDGRYESPFDVYTPSELGISVSWR